MCSKSETCFHYFTVEILPPHPIPCNPPLAAGLCHIPAGPALMLPAQGSLPWLGLVRMDHTPRKIIPQHSDNPLLKHGSQVMDASGFLLISLARLSLLGQGPHHMTLCLLHSTWGCCLHRKYSVNVKWMNELMSLQEDSLLLSPFQPLRCQLHLWYHGLYLLMVIVRCK